MLHNLERERWALKDTQNQTPGKYVVFVHDVFGGKAAFYCDGWQIAPGVVIFVRHSALDPKNVSAVAALPLTEQITWGAVLTSECERMTQEEWEDFRIVDGQEYAKRITKLFGKEPRAKVVYFHDGTSVTIPLTEEEAKAKDKDKPEGEGNPPTEPNGSGSGGGFYL